MYTWLYLKWTTNKDLLSSTRICSMLCGSLDARGIWGRMDTWIRMPCVCLVAQLCPTLCDPMDCSPPDSSVHRSFQARILQWVAISFSRFSRSKDRTHASCVSCITGGFLTAEVQVTQVVNKKSACQCRKHKRRGFYPWVTKILWRRAWSPNLVFLPEKSHGWRSHSVTTVEDDGSDLAQHTHMYQRVPVLFTRKYHNS